MKIINPATEEVVKEIAEDSAQTIQQKYALLKEGQKQWRNVALAARIQCIEKYSELLETNKPQLSSVLTSEMGKPLTQSANEINGARGRIKFFTENSLKWLSEEWVVSEGGTTEKITYELLGVIA